VEELKTALKAENINDKLTTGVSESQTEKKTIQKGKPRPILFCFMENAALGNTLPDF